MGLRSRRDHSEATGATPVEPTATKVRGIGWYRAEDGTRDECYWDGRSWLARRRPSPQGGWTIVPV